MRSAGNSGFTSSYMKEKMAEFKDQSKLRKMKNMLGQRGEALEHLDDTGQRLRKGSKRFNDLTADILRHSRDDGE